MAAIYKRELKSYFQCMTGYVFIAFLVLFVGIYFMAYNLMSGYPYFSYTLSGVLIVFLVGIPLITMKSFSEERKNKTDQLLLTAPVTVADVVVGKYLAMITVFGIVCLLTCFCPLIMSAYGGSVQLADYGSILAFFLMGCAAIAMGMFISSLTESQIIASVGTFGALLVLFLMSNISSLLPSASAGTFLGFCMMMLVIGLVIYLLTKNWVLSAAVCVVGIGLLTGLYLWKPALFSGLFQTVLNSLSLADRFNNFINQIFDLSAIVYYITFSAVFVFLSAQAVQKRRWS